MDVSKVEDQMALKVVEGVEGVIDPKEAMVVREVAHHGTSLLRKEEKSTPKLYGMDTQILSYPLVGQLKVIS